MSDIPAFPVVIVAGLTVFGLAFIASEGVDFDTDNDPDEETVFFEDNPGEVGSATQTNNIKEFGDFTVGDLRGDVQVERERVAGLESGLFSSQILQMDYNATEPYHGEIEFDVVGRDGPGAVYIDVNGERVFEEQMITGSSQRVEIPAGHFSRGMNEIVVGTTRGGLLSSTQYTLEFFEATINDRTFHDYQDSFRVYDFQLQDFVEADLTFSIPRSIPAEPLEIFINDNGVYSHEQVRISPEEVELTPNNADLRPGYNSIRFETGSEAEYEIENAQFEIEYIGTTDIQTVNREFEMTDGDLNMVEDGDRENKIRFNYQRLVPGTRPMEIRLNDNSYELTPTNGENQIQVEEESFREGENTLEVRSNTTYMLQDLQILSEKVG